MKNYKINTDSFKLSDWERRGIFDEPRLTEICQLYKELGYELLILDYEPDSNDTCSLCLTDSGTGKKYKVVYTRKIREEK